MVAARLFRYSIDRINGRYISGWCFNRVLKQKTVRLTFSVDGRYLGQTESREYRRDLRDKGLHPTGLCGFDFNFPDDFDPSACSCLEIAFDGIKKPAHIIYCRDIPQLRPEYKRPVWFMHIPRTAGTSFNALARRCFPPGLFATHIERLEAQACAEVTARAHYVAGHLPWSMIKTHPHRQRYDYYALLREPLVHLHSHLNYVRMVTTDYQHERHFDFRHNAVVGDLSERLNRIDFGQYRQVERFIDQLSGCELDFFDNIQTRYFLDYRPERVGRTDAAKAADNMVNFKLVGLTEAYDRFSDRFCADIGLQPQQQSLRSNKASRYRLFDTGDPAMTALLQPLIAADLELYQYARQRYWNEGL